MFNCYVILCTCTITRGIILDLVKDGYTKIFINSLRTFIARWGCPKNVISDNGKVFTADETQAFCSNKGLSWGFNLAKATWQGDFWESFVSLCKRCLKKVVGKRKLTFDELQGIIFEIEIILNNWPIYHIYDAIDDVITTPNSLLFGRNLESSNLISADTHMGTKFTSDELLRKHRHLEIIINEFWDVWRHHYLLELRQSQRIKKSNIVLPKLNNIVIIHDEKLPWQLWKLGQIVELYKSNDWMIYKLCSSP